MSIIALSAILSIGLITTANTNKRVSNNVGTIKTPESCQVGKNDFRCYAKYYAILTYNHDPSKAFADVRTAYDKDDYVKSQCHQIVHIIGRTAFKKYGSLAASYPKGDNFCWSGYYHGATEQAIGDIGGDKIKQQANAICAEIANKSRYSFDHFNCVHGLGHGFMSIDSYELFTSLQTCDLLTDQWDKSSCYGGVYMENVMVAVRENGYSKYLKADDLLYPCNAVDSKYKEQCYLMQSSYALQKNGYNFAETFNLCATVNDSFQDTCNQSIGRDASGSTSSDVSRTKANCDATTNANAKKNCMIGAVKDFVSFYHDDKQATDLCNAFGGELVAPCNETVKAYYATF